MLVKTWADLLRIEESQIQLEDNFFDLGGSSLLAMRAIEQSERELGIRTDARRYSYESLAQLAGTSAAAPAPQTSATTASRAPKALFPRVLTNLGRKGGAWLGGHASRGDR
jgi:hypothetical protein